MAVDFMENLESMSETAEIVRVNSIEEGYSMLDTGEALFFVNVTEGFFAGVMNGTNPPLDIVVRDNSSLAAYVTNQVFMALTGYLGIAQAAIYSALDIAYEYEFTDEAYSKVYRASNLTFLDRVFDKDQIIDKEDAGREGSYSLIEHYISVAVMLTLCFMAFILIPYIRDCSPGIKHKLSAVGLSNLHFFISNSISIIPALILAYIPCHIAVSIISGHFNPMGIIIALPSIIGIALIIALIGNISSNVFSGNIAMLFITLVLAYVGGGLIPGALLPAFIKHISEYTPGHFIISNIAMSLFG